MLKISILALLIEHSWWHLLAGFKRIFLISGLETVYRTHGVRSQPRLKTYFCIGLFCHSQLDYSESVDQTGVRNEEGFARCSICLSGSNCSVRWLQLCLHHQSTQTAPSVQFQSVIFLPQSALPCHDYVSTCRWNLVQCSMFMVVISVDFKRCQGSRWELMNKRIGVFWEDNFFIYL